MHVFALTLRTASEVVLPKNGLGLVALAVITRANDIRGVGCFSLPLQSRRTPKAQVTPFATSFVACTAAAGAAGAGTCR